MVPMHANHLLLGRPWRFERKAKHDRFKKGILLRRMEGHTHLHHCHLDRFMKTN
jgi:hypothetical protein